MQNSVLDPLKGDVDVIDEWIKGCRIIGGALGIVVLVLCLFRSVCQGVTLSIIGCTIYGVSIVALYTISSVYHGLRSGTAKKVFQVIDHCTICTHTS